MAYGQPSSFTHSQASASDAFARIERNPFPKSVALYPHMRLVGRLTVDDYMALMPDETPEMYAVSILAIDQPSSLTSIAHFLDLLAIEHGHGGLGRGSLWPLTLNEVRKALASLHDKGHLKISKTGLWREYQSLTLEESAQQEPATEPLPDALLQAKVTPMRQVLVHGDQCIQENKEGEWFLGEIIGRHNNGGIVVERRFVWYGIPQTTLRAWCGKNGRYFYGHTPEWRDLLIAAHALLRDVPGECPSKSKAI